MRYKIIKLIILIFFEFGLTVLHAQETITTTSGNAIGSGGTVSYSIGQVVYSTSTSSNGSMAQGVQQPYEISVISGIDEFKNIYLILSAYPNPTNEFLILKVDNVKDRTIQSLTYKLYDISGKLLESNKVTGYETTIFMRDLMPGTYLLKVIDFNKEVKTFKIKKN